MAGALGAAGGAQAVANSNIQGTAIEGIAAGINNTNRNNFGIMNQVAPMQAQLDMQVDNINQNRNVKVYDDTNKTLQNADNFQNWKVLTEARLFNDLIGNRANTANLNSTYDYLQINPEQAGAISFKGGKAYEKAPVTDQASMKKAYFDNVAEYSKNVGRVPTAGEIEGFFKYIGGPNATPDISNAQLEMQRRAASLGYPGSQGKSGKEIKRMVVPFYTGKMGT
jgi:hypothetical protein